MLSLGFVQSATIPQLVVHINKSESIDIIVIKSVDDLLSCGSDPALKWFVNAFVRVFILDEVLHRPGSLRHFGIRIIQDENNKCTIDGDEKLTSIEVYPLTRTRQPHRDEALKAIER